MAEIAMDHPYATWPSVLALAVLVLTCIICVVRRRNFKKPTKTYVYKPLLDQEGTCYSFISRLHSGFFGFFLNPEEIGPSWSGTNLRTDVLVNDVQVHGKVPVSFENANKAEESEDEEEIYSRSNVA